MRRLAFLTILVILSFSLFSENQITIYNDGFALIRTDFQIELEKGLNDYYFENIPKTIESESVILKMNNNLQIYSQNYEFDLASSAKILDKYIGKNINILSENQNHYTGKLQFFDNSTIGIIEESTNQLVLINREDNTHIELEKLPDNFFLKPTLHWKFNALRNSEYDVEMSYICNQFKWHVTYNAVLKENKLRISPWVTITNNSGKSFNNIKLKLMAGEIAKIRKQRTDYQMAKSVNATRATMRQPEFKEKAFSDYHLYTLDKKVDINNKQNKQITLFKNKEVI